MSDNIRHPAVEEADYIVVGSGAAGGIIACRLARAGHEVIILEEGPIVDRHRTGMSVIETFNHACREAGIDVFPVPGPSAVIAALSASGAPSDRFTFGGFPPTKKSARKKFFEPFAAAPGVLIFYETGKRLSDSLADMATAFGDRDAVVARELTKIHETFRRGALTALTEEYATAPPKGEIVVLVFPQPVAPTADADIDVFLENALKEMSVKEAAAAAAHTLNIPRRVAYERALSLRQSPARQDQS